MSLSSKGIYFKSGLILLSLLLIGGLLFQISKARSFQFFGKLINRVETSEKVVALTFDDGPTPRTTEEVLKILAEKNIKATFYVIGQNADQYPKQLQKIVEQGNELGNHSYSHQRFLFKAQSFIDEEIKKTDQLIRQAGYAGEITFRPPNGKKLFGLPWYLSKHEIKTIMWDIEPDTYYQGNVENITRHTLDNVKPGSIILLHPLCDNNCEADRQALPKIIDGLTAEGYRFVTISQLLTYN